MRYRPKNMYIPEYIAVQWEDMPLEERRLWIDWAKLESNKAEEQRAFWSHYEDCDCYSCRVFKQRCRTKWVRDGKVKRTPKPQRWKDGKR